MPPSTKNMKKVLPVFVGLVMASMTACGPSAEEVAAEKKRVEDSIAAALAAQIQDSLARVEQARQDSLAQAALALQDSLKMKAMEDSLAALTKKVQQATKPKSKPKTTTPPTQDTKPTEAKPGMGRG